ncbi:NlpC/P60 family protein [Arthrobacter sp. CC3]|uniref:NlpC/P60 family protein n=1 Tax=Arthrobacter sp. CC3 TaxID=3029185 RepID=UPI003263E7B5
MLSRKLPAHHRSTAPAGRSGATSAGGRSRAGRQVAVIAAASGLVLSSGMAAQAAEAPAERDSAPAPAAPAVSVQVQAAVPASAPAPAAGGVNAAMVSAAYAQLGITQDCTAMVEKALGSAGIPVGDLGPMQFMNYGSVVGEPQPGDMVVQSGHVGIYIGDGQVISGGMNGVNATVTHPLSWLTATGGVTFVRAGA